MNLYLVLCENQQGQRWYEITDEQPALILDHATHFGPVECRDDYHSVMDAAETLANENDFSLDDEETWPLED